MHPRSIFTYQLKNATFNDLAHTSFRFGVVDDDDARLSRDHISALNAQGKSIWGYISTCEAESYRSYWGDNNWTFNPPHFLLSTNPEWTTSARVRFWEEDWQRIVEHRVDHLVREGYNGAYFDVVDTFHVPEVISAYEEDHPGGDIKQAAADFMVRLSQHAKALNPDFRIVMQNAGTLLSNTDITNLDDPLDPNERVLDAIDGVGKESTFSLGAEHPLSWTAWDARYIENALNAGKFVVGIEYPTTPAAEKYALNHMIKAGYIPYLDTRMTGEPIAISEKQLARVSEETIDQAAGDPKHGTALIGTEKSDWLEGNRFPDLTRAFEGNDTIYGWAGDDVVWAGPGNDAIHAGDGNDAVFAGPGKDILEGENGKDRLSGEGGDDTIRGGPGDDTIRGGPGDDTMQGGEGDDTFIYERGSRHDTIIDYREGHDRVALYGFGISGFHDLSPLVSYQGGNAEIRFDHDNSLLLLHVAPGSLNGADFLFL